MNLYHYYFDSLFFCLFFFGATVAFASYLFSLLLASHITILKVNNHTKEKKAVFIYFERNMLLSEHLLLNALPVFRLQQGNPL